MNELIRKYRNEDLYCLNCAEVMVYAGNEYYNLGLSENGLKMAAGFGGGVFEGHLCGTVSGAVAILGILFKGKTMGEENLLKIVVNEFKENFRKEYDEIECKYLVEHYSSEETGCNEMILRAANIVKEVVERYKN